MERILWLWRLGNWLTAPSVVPWIGALAAALAAVVVVMKPKEWLKSPWSGIRRAALAAVIWLTLMFVLSFGSRGGIGGGTGSGDGGGSDESRLQGSESNSSSVREVPADFPLAAGGGAAAVDMMIRFVPASDGATASGNRAVVKFACDVYRHGSGTKVEIRASDMAKLDELLAIELRSSNRPGGPPKSVRIDRSPDPGENVVRHLRDSIRRTLPQAVVDLGK